MQAIGLTPLATAMSDCISDARYGTVIYYLLKFTAVSVSFMHKNFASLRILKMYTFLWGQAVQTHLSRFKIELGQ